MKTSSVFATYSAIFVGAALILGGAFLAIPSHANASIVGGSGDTGCCGGAIGGGTGGASNKNDNGPWQQNTPPKQTPVPSCVLNASQTSIKKGESVTLSWQGGNVTSATMNQGIGAVPVKGSRVVSPEVTTTYTITFKGPYGNKSCSKIITVTTPQPGPTCDLSASPSHIKKGESVKISWTSTNAHAGSIDHSIGSVGPSGSTYAYPTQDTTYTGTFYGSDNKQVTCTVSVTVENNPPHHDNTPSCDLSVSDSSIRRGDKVTLRWESDNAEYGKIDQGIGRVDESGSERIDPTETTTYTGKFYNNDGDYDTCKVTVKVTRDTYVPPQYPPQTPYISLSAVPYTGLELGPVGTFVYWSFLVLWAFFAAYIIAVKQLHTGVYRWLKAVLFGEEDVQDEVVVTTHRIMRTAVAAPIALPTSDIDPFILAQINRKI